MVASTPLNLVEVFTSTTGIGSSMALGAAVNTLRVTAAQAGAVDGIQVTYVVRQGLDIEIGRGVLSSSATVVARSTPLISRVGGTVGVTKIPLAGSARVAFIQSKEDFAEMLARIATIEAAAPRGHINGLTLSNNATDAANDIDIARGQAASRDDAPVMMTLAAGLTKRLDAAWALGSGNGFLDQGSIANATYHVHEIMREDTGVVEAIASLSHDERATITMTIATPAVVTWSPNGEGHGLVAGSPFKFETTGALPTGVTAGTRYFVIATGLTPTTFRFSATNGGAAINTTGSQSGVHTGVPGPVLPASYTRFRRIGSIVRVAGAILPFVQKGNRFDLKAPVQDVSVGNLSTTSVTYPLPSVPIGIKVEALLSGFFQNAAANQVLYVRSLDQSDAAAAVPYYTTQTAAAGQYYAWAKNIITDKAGQIAARASAATSIFAVIVNGWIDDRGRS